MTEDPMTENVNTKNEYGQTKLMMAFYNGCLDEAQSLLDARADILHTDYVRDSVLHSIADSSHQPGYDTRGALELALKHGAAPMLKSKNRLWFTPVEVAGKHGKIFREIGERFGLPNDR
jgi:ankyrin repeat protein